MIWVISDTHFGHSRIIEYAARPFRDVDEMDATLVANWNNVVGNDDTVYHLGDYALCDYSRMRRISTQLKGKRILVRGNHDKMSCSKYVQWLGFEKVVQRVEAVVSGWTVLMAHRPPNAPVTGPTTLRLHGHTHEHTCRHQSPTCVNVSVEATGYAPMPLEKIIYQANKTVYIE